MHLSIHGTCALSLLWLVALCRLSDFPVTGRINCHRQLHLSLAHCALGRVLTYFRHLLLLATIGFLLSPRNNILVYAVCVVKVTWSVPNGQHASVCITFWNFPSAVYEVFLCYFNWCKPSKEQATNGQRTAISNFHLSCHLRKRPFCTW